MSAASRDKYPEDDEEVYVGEHMLIIGEDGFTAGCSCGWEGRERHDDKESVIDEWDYHCDVVFMEATGG